MNITAHGLTANPNPILSVRETECLLAIAAGRTTKEVARDLGIAPGTVEKRLLAATTKLGVTRRAALVMEAFRRGFISFACGIEPGHGPHQEPEGASGVLIA